MTTTAETACDAGAAGAGAGEGEGEGGGAKRPRLVLATTILASSLSFVDGSVVNVGLSAIGADLKAGSAVSPGSSTLISCRSAPCCFWAAPRATASAAAGF